MQPLLLQGEKVCLHDHHLINETVQVPRIRESRVVAGHFTWGENGITDVLNRLRASGNQQLSLAPHPPTNPPTNPPAPTHHTSRFRRLIIDAEK